MEEIPIYDRLTRDTLYLIAVELDMPDLLSFCLSSRELNKRILNDNNFWLFKLRHDFNFNEIINKEMAKVCYQFLYVCKDSFLEHQLVLSCVAGYLPIVKYLIKKGADIHVLNVYAWVEANKRGHTEAVNYLKSIL